RGACFTLRMLEEALADPLTADALIDGELHDVRELGVAPPRDEADDIAVEHRDVHRRNNARDEPLCAGQRIWNLELAEQPHKIGIVGFACFPNLDGHESSIGATARAI